MSDPDLLRRLERRLQGVEARTGAQIVVATVDRADVYHGLRWRAFALGVAAAGTAFALGRRTATRLAPRADRLPGRRRRPRRRPFLRPPGDALPCRRADSPRAAPRRRRGSAPRSSS